MCYLPRTKVRWIFKNWVLLRSGLTIQTRRKQERGLDPCVVQCEHTICPTPSGIVDEKERQERHTLSSASATELRANALAVPDVASGFFNRNCKRWNSSSTPSACRRAQRDVHTNRQAEADEISDPYSQPAKLVLCYTEDYTRYNTRYQFPGDAFLALENNVTVDVVCAGGVVSSVARVKKCMSWGHRRG